MCRRRQTSGSVVGWIPRRVRASCTVQVNGARGGRSRYRAQQACKTLRSNGALWAARNAALSIQARSVGQNSANEGASRTSFQVRPWRSLNVNRVVGGRIR